jgi:hypothetical protein
VGSPLQVYPQSGCETYGSDSNRRMAFSCLRKDSFTKEFTVLLVNVIQVLQPSALVGSAAYARELVDSFCFLLNTHKLM